MNIIGYGHLIRHFNLKVCEPGLRSYVWEKSARKDVARGMGLERYYPASYFKDCRSWTDHLRFAFKHEGINLEILSALFRAVPREEILALVGRRPTAGFSRRLWFCHEFLTGETLPLEDLANINYIPLLDEKVQVVRPEGTAKRERRHKILNNLPGNRAFCPLLYLLPESVRAPERELKALSEAIRSGYSDDVQFRALRYLFVKETKSSFAIERVDPGQRRMDRFVALLREMPSEGPLTKERLLDWQARIVDERYRNASWRTDQVYVGQTLAPGRERIHFIAPKAEDLEDLMSGWLACAEDLLDSPFDAVLGAALLSFAFVFIHPFDDGNGRIHRALMHYCLARRRFTEAGGILPVSASFLRKPHLYDAMLESFSRRAMPLVSYEIDDRGEIAVLNETAPLYRYPDMTYIADQFVRLLRETMETDWREELSYLRDYDRIRERMRRIVDLPEKKAVQFVTFVQQNGGRLSKGKRALFPELTDGEVFALERAIGTD